MIIIEKTLKKALEREEKRQNSNIILIASENFVSDDILKLQGSVFTNKYAEGYPNKRYYAGCENVDIVENLAIEYAKKLFNCKYANVQPHSGSSANMAVMRALLNTNDKIMGMNLNDGGHLTHGHPINFSGLDYKVVSYSVDYDSGKINYESLMKLAKKEKPKMIIAGASSYSQIIDFKKFREIADSCNALLLADISHIAGLIVTGLHPSAFPYADVVTSTTHKTLRGPRGGIILTNNLDIIKKINSSVFPGIQGGPLMHVISAKAQCFYEALQPSFKTYQENVIKNCKILSDTLKKRGFKIISNDTYNHLLLVDVKCNGLTGLEAENILTKIGIIVNKNVIPNDLESPNITSGIRLGSPAMTTKGLKEKDFEKIGNIIADALINKNDINKLSSLKQEVDKIMESI